MQGAAAIFPPLPFCGEEGRMRRVAFSVPEDYDGVKLKGFLRGPCRLSARQMARLKRVPGGLTRNGLPAAASDVLRAGDRVALTFPDEKIPEPAPLPLAVIYEDGDLLAVDKPAGMPMYPSPGHDRDSLFNAVGSREAQRGEAFAFRPVYRLDKDTTGLVVLAKHAYAASRLAGNVSKLYLAVCEGRLAGGGRIDLPIALKPGHSIQRAAVPGGAPAVTRWRCLRAGKAHSLLVLKLETGRTHQIRVHLSALGHPLAGDDMYGGSLAEISRQALHCCAVRFRQPVTGRLLRLRSAPPADMAALLRAAFPG